MNDIPLFEVSRLIRHASIQITEHYALLAPENARKVTTALEGGHNLVFLNQVCSIQATVTERYLVDVRGKNWRDL